MSIGVIKGLLSFKSLLLFAFLIFTVLGLSSCVSAASLTVDEVGYGSGAVVSTTQSNGYKIPGYVKVNGKNSTSPSFLNTLTKTTVQVNQKVKTPVTISSVKAAPSPSGSATGNLTKSQYITMAGNVKSFISSNGRAPNYASSPLGNIRYESLVYFYAKIMRHYKINDQLPTTMNVLNIPGTKGGVNIQDTTRPTVTASPGSGIYNTSRKVTLTAKDNVDSNPSIYYTTNGKNPTTSSTKYTTPITISTTTTLKFIARDSVGNVATVQTRTYTIDKTPPTVTANLATGVYKTSKSVTLTASDNVDSNPVIYYTTNGSTPTTSSTKYASPITISKTTTLKFIARDKAGNQAAVQTKKFYYSIQEAVNGASNQGTIRVNSGTYIENVIVNKPLTIISASGASVTVQAKDTSGSVFTIIPNGSGSTIQGFNIKGSANLAGILLYQSSNCIINGNTVRDNYIGILIQNTTSSAVAVNNVNSNAQDGIYLIDSNDITLNGNKVSYNGLNGIYLSNSDNNEASGNNELAHNQANGIYLDYSYNNIISENTIMYNQANGIFLSLSDSNNLSENDVIYNDLEGIFLYNSVNNEITENSIANNQDGIFIAYADGNTISYNDVTGNILNGIYLDNSDYNIISNDLIDQSEANGIYFNNSNNNRLYGNNIVNSGLNGIYLDTSEYNIISDNV